MTDAKRKERLDFIVTIVFWAFIVALVYFTLKYFLNLVMPFFVATILAALARPLARLMSKKTRLKKNKDGTKTEVQRKFRIPYNAAAIISVVLLFIVLIGILAVVAVPLINYIIKLVSQVPGLFTNTIKPALESAMDKLNNIGIYVAEPFASVIESAIPNVISSLGSLATSVSAKVVGWATSLVTSLPSALLTGMICLIGTVFIAVDFDLIKGFVETNSGKKARRVIHDVKESLVATVGRFLKSYFVIFLITAAEITVGLLILGKPNALLFGALIAVFDAFPVVGSGMILLPWAIITFFTQGFWPGFGLLVLYIIVVVVRQIIEPKIVGQHVGLRPIVTLLAMYVGTKLFGGIGLFALPIAAAIIADINGQNGIHIFNKPKQDEPEAETLPPEPAEETKE